MVYSHGPMVESIKATTSMTKRKVMVYFTGLMVASMKVDGKMANSMV